MIYKIYLKDYQIVKGVDTDTNFVVEELYKNRNKKATRFYTDPIENLTFEYNRKSKDHVELKCILNNHEVSCMVIQKMQFQERVAISYWEFDNDKFVTDTQEYIKIHYVDGVMDIAIQIDTDTGKMFVRDGKLQRFVDDYNIERIINASPNFNYKFIGKLLDTDGEISSDCKISDASFTVIKDPKDGKNVLFSRKDIYDLSLSKYE